MLPNPLAGFRAPTYKRRGERRGERGDGRVGEGRKDWEGKGEYALLVLGGMDAGVTSGQCECCV